ncbi:hypothetical protein AMTR_s00023p00201780 [Amborella trichopoda]|uniref:Uncharacterized protein n=1 Tax=Amborella trichopoda TaxID=13333 RepID=W1NJK2_AMBTC|nr:hypothetical protein AMTR_s00023p00201780 [Amborella trichopoda]
MDTTCKSRDCRRQADSKNLAGEDARPSSSPLGSIQLVWGRTITRLVKYKALDLASFAKLEMGKEAISTQNHPHLPSSLHTYLERAPPPRGDGIMSTEVEKSSTRQRGITMVEGDMEGWPRQPKFPSSPHYQDYHYNDSMQPLFLSPLVVDLGIDISSTGA